MLKIMVSHIYLYLRAAVTLECHHRTHRFDVAHSHNSSFH